MDALLRRRAMIADGGGSPTPPGPPYDSVDYLQFNQSALNTGIEVTGTDYKVEIQCQVVSDFSTTQIIVGISDNGGNWFGNLSGKYGVGANNANKFTSYQSSEKKTFTISYGSRTSVTDGTSTISINRASGTTEPICVGRAGTGNFWSYVKVWYVKVYNGSTLVRDFIPVKKDNVGYFYDRISQTLFSNTGTNAFIIGE